MGQVEARLIHGFADHVIADVPGAAEAVAQVAGVHGPHGGDGVALDAGDLDQAADGVAGEAQVVLQGNFRRILHLVQVEAVKLGQAAGGHGAGHAHLCLAAAFGPGDGGVLLGQIPQNAGGGQGPENLLFGAAPDLLDIPQNRRQDAGGAAGGGGDDDAVVCILLRHGVGVGADDPALQNLGHLCGQLVFIELLGLPLHVQPPGEDASGGQTV